MPVDDFHFLKGEVHCLHCVGKKRRRNSLRYKTKKVHTVNVNGEYSFRKKRTKKEKRN